MTSETLDDLENTKDKDMVVPLGSGLMLEVARKDVKNVMVNIGAKTTMEMSIPDAKKKIDEMRTNIEGFKTQVSGQLNELQNAMNQVMNQMAEDQEKAKKKSKKK